MGRLVGDLLLLARADAGRLPAHRRCDLAEIAGDAAAEVAPLMGDRELTIDNERPLRVEGSPDELHRMVLNLLDNAARHTPPGARIELRARAQTVARRVVEVADDGPGIPAELREQIFDRFVRGEGPADTAAAPAAASAWRSSAPSPRPTAARVEVDRIRLRRRPLPRPHPPRRAVSRPRNRFRGALEPGLISPRTRHNGPPGFSPTSRRAS